MSERLEKLIDMDREAQNGFDVDLLDLNEMAIIPREDFEWLIEQAAELNKNTCH